MVENQPVEVMAYMGKLAGVADPYNMTPDELAKAKDLADPAQAEHPPARPAEHRHDRRAQDRRGLASRPATSGPTTRVKDQGGPELKVFTPKEGTIGWMDAEMIVKGGANTNLILPVPRAGRAGRVHRRELLLNGRPLFNEKAYKLLVNQGQQERADRFLYNKPETVLTMTLKGPGASTQAAIDAFNEVFGA